MDSKVIVQSDNYRWNFRGRHALEVFLEKENIKPEDCCIIGGLVFNAYGLRYHGDIDLIVSDDNLAILLDKYDVKHYHVNLIEFNSLGVEGDIKLNRFEPLGLQNNDIIYNSDYYFLYDGFKILRLELAFAVRFFDCSIRVRDQKASNDIKLVEKYIGFSELIGGVCL